MRSKTKSIIYLTIIVLVIGFLFIVVTQVRDKKRREENKLYNKLNDIVLTYYKDYYYKIVLGSDDSLRKSNAANLSKNGIKITLNQLANYKGDEKNTILDEFKNYKTNTPCDYDKTIIMIYPKEPYGDQDIRIESTIECGIK